MELEHKEVNIKFPSHENVMIFHSNVDDNSVKDFVKDYVEKCRIVKANTTYAENQINEVIEAYNKNPEEYVTLCPPFINVILSTFGGSVYDGFNMCNTLRTYSKLVPTNLYASGMCMSMGIPIMCSVPYDHRFAFRNTTFMIHQLSSVAYGKFKDIKDEAAELERLHKELFDIIVRNTEIPQYKLDEVYEKKLDWFFTAEEALNYGLISAIVDTPKF